MTIARITTATFIFITAATPFLMAGEPSFTGVGALGPGATGSIINAVTPDGTVAVGFTNSSAPGGGEAFQWTSDNGITGLGVGTGSQSVAYGVSNNGTVIAGDSISDSGSQSFQWTQPNNFTVIGDIPGGGNTSVARAVSADGTTIVGQGSSTSGLEAYRWTQANGFEPLGFLPGGEGFSLALDVSTDGQVIVGESDSIDANCFACPEAFRWTPDGGMQPLGDLPGGEFRSSAQGMSPDGTYIVGQGLSDNGLEAFIWTEQSGMTGLGDLDGGAFESRAFAVSADGSTIVGEASADNGVTAFIWTESTGMITVRSLIENELNLDITGWQLNAATDISDDGLTIVGNGVNPTGQNEAWVLRVPEPTTAVILAMFVIVTGRRDRR